MHSTTIKDIAKKLNISASTVSRALHDHPDVNRATKKKIQELARELDYHPNIIAQNLKRKRSNTIGVIVPQVRHSFFASIMAGISDVAYEAGYTVMVCQSNDKIEHEIINTKALISQHVAGMLISISQSTNRTDHFQMVLNRRIPIVFFDRVCEEIEATKVVVDDYSGAFEAVEYLIQSGRKRIAHLAGPLNLSIARERMAGYREALAKYGLPWRDDLVVFGGLNEEDGTSGFVELLNRAEEPPDAVFAVNDPVACGAYLVIREKGIAIPRDMALIGFSDSPLSSLIDPPLTTVRQPAYEMGKTAAEFLIDQIENNRLVSERKVLPTEFVKRGSA